MANLAGLVGLVKATLSGFLAAKAEQERGGQYTAIVKGDSPYTREVTMVRKPPIGTKSGATKRKNAAQKKTKIARKAYLAAVRAAEASYDAARLDSILAKR